MNAANPNHPDRSDLEAFGVGRLDPARSAAVAEHIASRESYCEAVQKAPDDKPGNQLREAGTLPPQPTPVGAVPPLQKTVAQETIDQLTAAESVEAPDDLARHPRYRLMKLLGRGGMGAVFQAEHGVMRRLVALKVINREYMSNPAAAERFQREIRAAAQLHHPNIVGAYDAEQAGDTHFLVMEYIEGQSLDRIVVEKGPLPVAEACESLRQAALGLQHAHARGMVHRDVKPHNLIRNVDGVVKVLDFGLASVGDRGEGPLTGTNVIMGTPDYIAPEQAEDTHAADARSDIYALGCTLYHLLTGRPPFTNPSTLLKLVAHREETPAPVRAARPDVPAELAAILGRMMAKAPVDRYQTAAEVADALAPFANGTALPKPRLKSRRRLLAAAALAAICVAGLAAAVAAVMVRIQTDRAEAAIQTDDPSIEVVTKGGKLVRIVDPQSKQTWELDPEKYQLGMADRPEGLTIALDGKAAFVLKRKGQALVSVSLSATGGPRVVAQEGPIDREYEIKAAYLYNFGRYVEWPKNAVPATDDFVIGVLGRDPFGRFLDDLAGAKTLQDKKILIRRFASAKDYQPCHILFVAARGEDNAEEKTVENRVAAAQAKIKGSPVLLVSDAAGLAEKGVLLNFFIDDRRIKFEVNPTAATRASLKISSQLLELPGCIVFKINSSGN